MLSIIIWMIFAKMKQSFLFIYISFYLAYFQSKLSSGYYHVFNSDYKLKEIINWNKYHFKIIAGCYRKIRVQHLN